MIFAHQDRGAAKFFYNMQAWHNRFFVYNFFISFTLFLFILGEAVWAFFIFGGVDFISLHYSIYFGVDWLGNSATFFTFPVFGFVLFLINYILATALYAKKRMLSYFLISGAALLQLFIFIATSLAIYINWSTIPVG